ncbi:hypothetical protein Mterra_04126 [Calidithermus terrae]|uniref:Uncharacterized protein n=1 Tax=Calidithermus terrae TaxID=1408545 RepID=A0A399DP91_9DEIN|nr:hypothetical protein Mterra_04126 [Calidithermus terrae]
MRTVPCWVQLFFSQLGTLVGSARQTMASRASRLRVRLMKVDLSYCQTLPCLPPLGGSSTSQPWKLPALLMVQLLCASVRVLLVVNWRGR